MLRLSRSKSEPKSTSQHIIQLMRARSEPFIPGPALLGPEITGRSRTRSRTRSHSRSRSRSRSQKTPISHADPDSESDKSSIFIQIISQKLLPLINELFQDYIDEPDNFLKPTNHLCTKLLNTNLEKLEEGYNTVYRIDIIPDTNYQIILTINKNSFSLLIVSIDNFENTPEINNISVSPQRDIKMYIYGVKANGIGPKIKGNVLNSTAFEICKAMHIPELYISDSAGVKCYWDERIELEHFSILRVMVGKPTFYESLNGHFFNVEKAMEEKERIQTSITEEEKQYILYYLSCLQNNKKIDSEKDNCNKINEIIKRGLLLLPEKPEIFRYVATPYNRSGGSKGGKYKIKTRKVRKVRKVRKHIIQ